MYSHVCKTDKRNVNLARFPCPYCGQRITDEEDQKLIVREKKKADREAAKASGTKVSRAKTKKLTPST